MKKRVLKVEVLECPESELTDSDSKLLFVAKKSASRAYAPYSKFKVGSAVLLANDIIVAGNNQENAAYPSGLCAERVALFFAVSQYPAISVKAIAITHVPCGACRQVIHEYETKQGTPVRVIMLYGKNKVFISEGISNLLPLAFGTKELKKA